MSKNINPIMAAALAGVIPPTPEHTPGPWTFGQTLNQGLAVWHSKVGGPDYVIAMHHGSGAKAYADVQLIAAAPDLLRALKELLETAPYTDLGEECECRIYELNRACTHVEARRAIKKAEGSV